MLGTELNPILLHSGYRSSIVFLKLWKQVSGVGCLATDAAGGAFEQSHTVNVINDPSEYSDWSAALPLALRATNLDPNGDGIPNLVASGLGATAGQFLLPENRPTISATGEDFYFEFPIANPTPAGISYHLERSENVADCSVVASKTGAAA